MYPARDDDAVVPQIRQPRFVTPPHIENALVMKNGDRFVPTCTIGVGSNENILLCYREGSFGDPKHAYALRMCRANNSTLSSLASQKQTVQKAAIFMEELPTYPTILKIETHNRNDAIVMELGWVSLDFFLKKEGRHLSQEEICDLSNDLVSAVLFLMKNNSFSGNICSKHVILKIEADRIVFKLSPHKIIKKKTQQVAMEERTDNGYSIPLNDDLIACARILRSALSYPVSPLQEDTAALLTHTEYDDSFCFVLHHLIECLQGPIGPNFEDRKAEINVLLEALKDNNSHIITVPNFKVLRHTHVSKNVSTSCSLSGNPPVFHEIATLENCNLHGATGVYQINEQLDLASLCGLHFIAFKDGLEIHNISWTDNRRSPLYGANVPRRNIQRYLHKGRQALQKGQTLIDASMICRDILSKHLKKTINGGNVLELSRRKSQLETTMSAHFEVQPEDILEWDSKEVEIEQINQNVEDCFVWLNDVRTTLLCLHSYLHIVIAQP